MQVVRPSIIYVIQAPDATYNLYPSDPPAYNIVMGKPTTSITTTETIYIQFIKYQTLDIKFLMYHHAT